MAYGRASKQTYFGRVIYPAEKKQYNNKNFLQFYIYVDKLAKEKKNGKYEAVSARIQCSYFPRGNNPELDPIVAILTRVSCKEHQNSLAGHSYSSVELVVEGSEKLVAVEGKGGAYYKSLEYTDVSITDNEVVKAYRRFRDAMQNGGQPSAPTQSAPVPAQTQAPQIQTPQTPQYSIGDLATINGVYHKLINADATNPNSWVPGQLNANGVFVPQGSLAAESVVNATNSRVQEIPPVAPAAPVQAAPAAPVQAAPALSNVGKVLSSESYSEAPPSTGLPNAVVTKNPVV